MNIAIKRALKVLKTNGLLDYIPDFQQISTMIDREKIIFSRFPFKGRLRERYICTPDNIAIITIHEQVSNCELKHLTAHALGHHFLHKGNYAFINEIVLDKQENQAEDFAAILLVPPPALKKIKPATVYELAGECDIPIELAERRTDIFKRHGL